MFNSLTVRIVMALILAAGFYGLAVGIVAGLGVLVYAQVALWDFSASGSLCLPCLAQQPFFGQSCRASTASSHLGLY